MQNTKNAFPVGIDDFKELIACRGNTGDMQLFIDKSLMIRDLLQSKTKVSLFTRPRRFGKTLVLSMLEYFFSAEISGEPTAGMFDDLKIAAYPEHMKHQGQYPVIFISFKDAKCLTFEETLFEIKLQIRKLYKKCAYLLHSTKLNEEEINYVSDIIKNKLNDLELRDSLQALSELMFKHYEKKVIILIDEYDSPIHAAYSYGYYEQCINFMRPLLSKALKGNIALQFSVITGILRVAKESLFSGLNNLGVYSVLDPEFSEYFGFTEPEVIYLLNQSTNKAIDHQAIQQNYNGYLFGKTVIYNPWSIINCLNRDGKVTNYWVNTADSSLIQQLVVNSSATVKETLNRLIQGEKIREVVDESLVFNNIASHPSSVYMFLLMAGYLTASDVRDNPPYPTTADFKIPNLEILKLYYEIVQGWLADLQSKDSYGKVLHELLLGDVESFITKLQEVTESIVSYFDVGANSQEKFYHGMMLGIAAGVTPTHEVRSNRESGRGRYDLMIIPKDVTQHPLGIVMEFKFTKDKEQLDAVADEALEQIQTQKYLQELNGKGIKQALMIGIGFAGKETALKYKRVD